MAQYQINCVFFAVHKESFINASPVIPVSSPVIIVVPAKGKMPNLP